METADQDSIDGSALELYRMDKIAESVLRVASMALSTAGLVIMIKNSYLQRLWLSFVLESWRYLASVNVVCVTYSLLSALAILAISCPISKLRFWILLVFDQMATYAVLAAGTVSAETVYLAYCGNKFITWSSVCDGHT